MNLVQISDAELVDMYICGNEAAFEQLVSRHQSRIYGFIFSKVLDHDLSNDIFQETFIKVIRTIKKGSYKEEGKFLPWVLRIAGNLIIDYFRKTAKNPVLKNNSDKLDIFNLIQDPTSNIEKELIENQIHKDLRNLIDQLPENQRSVLIMRHFKEMSFKEISESTGVSINTALGRMRYALINLRKLIEKKQIILTK